MRAAWLACFFWATLPFAALSETYDPDAECDGMTTVDMMQCGLDQEAKAQQLLDAVMASMAESIAQLGSEGYAEDIQIAEMKAALSAVKRSFPAYVEAMGKLNYWHDYPGSIRQITTPQTRHGIIYQHAVRLLVICQGMEYQEQKTYDLSHTDWCSDNGSR